MSDCVAREFGKFVNKLLVKIINIHFPFPCVSEAWSVGWDGSHRQVLTATDMVTN